MKNTRRITVVMKDQVLASLDKDVFGKRLAKVATRESALVLAVMKQAFPDFRKLQAAPKGWLPMQKSVQVSLSATYVELVGKEAYQVPYSALHNRCILALSATEELAERIEDLRHDKKRIRNERDALKAEVGALIGSCSTVGKLIEVWPAGKKYLPDWALTEATALPAVQVEVIDVRIADLKKAA